MINNNTGSQIRALRQTRECALAVTGLLVLSASPLSASAQQVVLEEVIVTAQKREESLQKTPMSVTSLNSEQLKNLGFSNMGDLASGAIPSLKVQPYFNGPTTTVVAMRGIGSSQADQITKDPGVGIYADGVYLGRSTGLAISLADLERIEVVRGPQGTLYGRNSLGGAVNFISRKPEGEFALSQTFSLGNYDYVKSLTHLDLPEIANVSAKISYLNSSRDGWVKNDFLQSRDFHEADDEGLRVALDWQPTDRFSLNYAYEHSESTPTSMYWHFTHVFEVAPGFQLFNPSVLDDGRQDETRIGLPLRSSRVEVDGHNMTAEYELSDSLSVKSITGYREMDEEYFSQYGGVFSVGQNGQGAKSQSQFSQELQLIGQNERWEYVAGLYWFEEDGEATQRDFGTVIFAPTVPTPNGPTPFNAVPVFAGPELFVLNGLNSVQADTESYAVFGQLKWTPPVLADNLDITLGLRFTSDEKSGFRSVYLGVSDDGIYEIENDRVDPAVSINYFWTPDVSTFLRYATGYRAGGANILSSDFITYDEEEVASWELGIKMQILESRVRLNATVWQTEYSDKQIDFPNPQNVTETTTINASNGDVDLSGLEVELSSQVSNTLRVDVTYEYMDGSIKDQFNPFTGQSEAFGIQSLPRHSGTLSADYLVANNILGGSLTFNVNYISTGVYLQNPKNVIHKDARDIINARLSLADISVPSLDARFRVDLWGKNITDEEYYVSGIQSAISGAVAYGDPRTYGIDISLEF